MRKLLSAGFAVALATAATAQAADLNVKVEVPRLDVAEYHKPYVATWIEREDGSVATTLSVWYDIKMKDEEGQKWLKDMRQWWRKVGREGKAPLDAVSGATRGPGVHALNFSAGKAPLGKLAAGNYKLVVEAAREVGGREVVSIPFQWPAAKAQTLSAKGKTELGEVSLDLKP